MGEEWTPKSLPGANASPAAQDRTASHPPPPNPWVLTASSVPLNRTPVGCGIGGSGGATRGGRRGGSSLLRLGLGFAAGRSSLGPGSIIKSRAPLSRKQQVTAVR